MPGSPPARVLVGPFELDLRSGELSRNGRRQTLPEQPLALLKALIERPGDVVTRSELRAQLWPGDTFVDFEHGLNAAVKRLRDALGDSADTPAFIETVPRRGYRLIAAVNRVAGTPAEDLLPASHEAVQGDYLLEKNVVREPSTEPATRWSARRKLAAIAAVLLVSIAGAALWWNSHHVAIWASTSERSSAPRHLTRLTFGSSLDGDATWSPDGRSIAYSSDAAGNFDIWITRVDTREAIQITKSPAHERQPTWSPDGSTIAFRSDRAGGGLFVVPANGGAERQLTSFGFRPKWAPDGSQILFASSEYSDSGGLTQLFTVRLDGTPPHPVLGTFLSRLQSMTDWRWYPDSRRVSVLGVSRGDPEDEGIYTVSLSGGEPRLLKQTNEFGTWTGFEWSPSGRIVYIDCEDHWAHSAGRFIIDPVAMTIVASERVTTGDGWEMRLAASRDAQRLAFTLSRMSLRLWAFPFDAATGRITGNGEPVTESGAYVGDWDLSPDGNKLAFMVERAGRDRREMWTTDLTNGRTRLLVADDQGRDGTHWSPDGHRLAYRWWRTTPSGEHEVALAIRQLDNDDEQLITTPDSHGFVLPFDWSPDGGWVLGSSSFSRKGLRQPNVRLTLWPLAAAPRAETGAKVLASDERYQAWQASFSPDGRWICFNGIDLADPEGSGIFVIPATGADRSRWTLVSDKRVRADKPRWSPDGNRVYYVRRDGSFINVWASAFDSLRGTAIGLPFRTTRFESPRLQISTMWGRLDIAVSSHRLIVTMMEQTGNIWMLDNVER